MCVLSCSVLSNSAIPVDCSPPDALCPWGFSRQEYWSGLLCPPAGDLPDPGIEPVSLTFPALAGRFFTLVPLGKPLLSFISPLTFPTPYLILNSDVPSPRHGSDLHAPPLCLHL